MTSNKPEMANYLPFCIQKYIETIYFWNQCERRKDFQLFSKQFFFNFFLLPPNFVLAINICFAICHLDIWYIVSNSLCAFEIYTA